MGTVDPATLGELSTLLIREIGQALQIALAEAPAVRAEKIVIRLGQEPAPEGGGGPETPLPSGRYPGLDRGWELEIALAGDGRVLASPLPTLPPSPAPPLMALFAGLPATVIKGLDASRTRKFAEAGVETVADLAELSDERLAALTARVRSIFPAEMRAKARMLKATIPPIPTSPLDSQTLQKLLFVSAADLLQALGPDRSTPTEARQLKALLDILAVAVDSRVLRRFVWMDLRKGDA